MDIHKPVAPKYSESLKDLASLFGVIDETTPLNGVKLKAKDNQ